MHSDDAVHLVQRELLRHADVLKGFLHALTGDRAAADDLFQEVFLVVTEKAATFTPGSDFLAWARAIARFKVMSYHARRRGQARHLDAETIELLSADPAPLDDGWEAHREALRACIERLAPAARHLLDQRYFAERLPHDIAQAEGRSVNAVAVALAKTLNFLRDCAGRRLSARDG